MLASLARRVDGRHETGDDGADQDATMMAGLKAI